MTALPDGTFWIGNGAQTGVAGFAEAQDPTYTAILPIRNFALSPGHS